MSQTIFPNVTNYNAQADSAHRGESQNHELREAPCAIMCLSDTKEGVFTYPAKKILPCAIVLKSFILASTSVSYGQKNIISTNKHDVTREWGCLRASWQHHHST